MSNSLDKSLQKASAQAYNILKKSTEDFRPDIDKSIHILNLSKEIIVGQILQRASGNRGKKVNYSFSQQDLETAEKLADTFISSVKKAATETSAFLCVDLAGNKLTYTINSDKSIEDGIVVIAKSPDVIAFNKAKSLIIAGEKSILGEFNTILSKRGEVFKLFDTGHLSGRSVSEEMQMKAAQKFATPFTTKSGGLFRPSVAILQEIDFGPQDKFYTLVSSAREVRKADRQFLISLKKVVEPKLQKYIKIGTNTVVMAIEPQSWEYNNFMAAIEKADKAAMATVFKEIKDLGAEYWVKKPGSPSELEKVFQLLVKASRTKTSKIKVNTKALRGKAEKPSYSSNKPKNIKTSKVIKPSSSSASLSGKAIGSTSPRPSTTNWASLINIINKRLPEQVAGNMGVPALVYRTGRFANSTKVVNVETTKEGYPSIVYDYQRTPYDVFDRTLGAAPWNTPARDPRALVDKSVREIVQEMAIGRFYTRRA